MRSIVLIILFCTTSLCGQTRLDSLKVTDKRRVLIGGSLYGYGSFSKNSSYSFQASPNYGKFVRPNLAMGVKAQFGFYAQKLSNYFNFSASPFIRYYIPSTKQLRIFFAADAGYYYYYSADNAFFTKYIYSGDGLITGGGPGITYFINKHVGLETLLRYEFSANRYYISKVSAENSRLYLLVGFQIYLNKKI